MKCPVCGSDKTYLLGDVTRFEKPFSIRRCSDCQSAFQFPLPINPNEFYDDAYYSGSANFSYIDERKIDSFARYVWDARIKKLARFHKGGVFLDVGCSFGGLVRAASVRYRAYGIDVSPYAVDQGNEFSKKIGVGENFGGLFKGDILDFSIPGITDNSVNIIAMIEVAEHLANPQDHFKKAYELLKPGGIFLIQTANMTAYQAEKAGLQYHYYLPGHLTYFSEGGLQNLLEQIGFTSVVKYFPVEFGLLPKLRKMSGGFTCLRDFLRWLPVIKYHVSSWMRYKNRPLTSSMVVYAIK